MVVENQTEDSSLQTDLAVWVLVGLALVLVGLPVYSLLAGGI